MEIETIKDIADSKLTTSIYNDMASPAMKQIGQSAEGLLKFVALPFKFLGLTAEQLEKKYEKFIGEALNRVPPQKMTAPQSSVVAPLLDYVKFCFADEPGNDLLQEMFSKLLSSCINQDNTSHFNKSFVETMRFLSGNEAKLLQWCSDAIITERIYDDYDSLHNDFNPLKPIWNNFVVLSSFLIDEYDDNQQMTEPPKTIEISTSSPYASMNFDFPTNESLDLLASLGLIKFKKETYRGQTFFEDLIRLKDQGFLHFEIPPIFASAMSFAKANYNYFAKKTTMYEDLSLSILLESDILQLNNILSQNQNISMKQLMLMDCSRSEVSLTPYGHRFLACVYVGD